MSSYVARLCQEHERSRRSDQMISLYNAGRKSMKVRCLFLLLRSCLHVVLRQGWKAILCYVLECAMLNSFSWKESLMRDIGVLVGGDII